MGYLILVTLYVYTVVGSAYSAPPDPLLISDVVGEPLSRADFELAEQLIVEETIPEYNEWNRDPLENSGVGERFFEGDIIGEIYPNIASKGKKWKKGKIPYLISSSFNGNERALIAKAMKQFKKKTCIKFKARKNNNKNYVHIVKGDGCSSMVGPVGGAQRLTLGNGCVQIGVIVHELLHAVGFWHEQSRTDRDNHVTIKWQNIMNGYSSNFEKMSNVNLLGLPYDLGSIMHYGKTAFSNGNGPTIVPKNGGSIGQRRGLSNMDIKKINKLYKC